VALASEAPAVRFDQEGAGPATAPQEMEDAAAGLDASRRTAIVQASGRVAPAVVTVSVLRTERYQTRSFFDPFVRPGVRRSAGYGSGFIVRAEGVILTNEHVVRGADRIMVTLSDGRDLDARLVGYDDIVDVAVLRVNAADLPVAPLGTSQGLITGEWVVAIGNPFGTMISSSEPTVTAGVVSAVSRNIVPSSSDQGFYLGMIQTDAAINPGNSGGPLVNVMGQVIGMNSSIFSRGGGSEGLGFAIPIDRVLRVAEDILEFGEVRRAWLGFDVEADTADDWGRTRGVRVARVVDGSPAAEAGIRPGVRLTEANGRRVTAPLDLEDVLLDLKPGDALALSLAGGGRPISLEAETLPTERAERITALQDLDVITVNEEVRAEQGLVTESGALVVSISPELQSNTGFLPGDVIVGINNARINTAAELASFFDGLRRGTRIRIFYERRGQVGARDFVWGG
jgi:serine protease Do